MYIQTILTYPGDVTLSANQVHNLGSPNWMREVARKSVSQMARPVSSRENESLQERGNDRDLSIRLSLCLTSEGRKTIRS